MERDIRNKLVEDNLNLVHYVANLYKDCSLEYDDIVGYGFEGLIKSAAKYDEKKSKFSTFAIRCIQNEINIALRREIKHNNKISIEEQFEKNNLQLEDLIEINLDNNPENIYCKKEDREELIKIVESLNEVEQELIKLRYGFYDNIVTLQTEIADKFNFTQSYASRYEKKILKKLKKKIN